MFMTGAFGVNGLALTISWVGQYATAFVVAFILNQKVCKARSSNLSVFL
jgi:hypothetical protein